MVFEVAVESCHPDNIAAAAARMCLESLTVAIMSNALHLSTLRGSYPMPAFPRHTFHGTVAAKVVFLVLLLQFLPALLCHGSVCLSGFCWMDFRCSCCMLHE